MSGVVGGALPSNAFWRGRRVLVTGHTGFKGSWLFTWLDRLGADVMGLSLPERPTDPSLWEALGFESVDEIETDIASRGWQDDVITFQPEVVFHLAAQSLVSQGYSQPLRTFTTNVLGSAVLLQALSAVNTMSAAVMVTTDKVYDTRQSTPFTEESYVGGSDPYSASKAAMELVVHSWPGLAFPVATARAGNVIGGGDWAGGRLLPDLVRSWASGTPAILRRPTAVRPWQHVLEPLRGYLLYAESLVSSAGVQRALNLGPAESQCVPVEDLVRYAASCWAKSAASETPPTWNALGEPPMKETELLVLDSSVARESIGWTNVLDWQTTVARTVDWYHAFASGTSARELVVAEIADYERVVESAST